MGAIRVFMDNFPLVDLVRVLLEDCTYAPKQLSGGEDWLQVFSKYWQARAERSAAAFIRERRRLILNQDIENFLEGHSLIHLPNYSPDPPIPAMPLRYEWLFSLWLSFFTDIFPARVNRTLKIILLEGEFYRPDNRLEFTDAYTILMKAAATLASFDQGLLPTGELGQSFFPKADIPLFVQSERVLEAQKRVLSTAEKISQEIFYAISKCVTVLKGIVEPQQGRYDTLQNLSSVDGRNNAIFMERLEESIRVLERISVLAKSIAELEGFSLSP
jgi:hypothetical protein